MMLEFVLGPEAGDLGTVVNVQGGWCRHCLGVLGWCLMLRLGLWWVYLGFCSFWCPVEWVRAVLPRGSCLLGRGARGSFPVDLLGVCGSLCRRWCSDCATGVLAGALGSVFVLLVSGCCGLFWISCSEVLERSK